MRGLAVAATVDCSLKSTTSVCKRFGADAMELPSLRLLPPPTYLTAAKYAGGPPGIAVSTKLDDLRKLTPRIFATHHVEIVSPDNMRAFLGRNSNSISRAILFTEKTRVPIVWRAVSFPCCAYSFLTSLI